jgi:hypothetical protein
VSLIPHRLTRQNRGLRLLDGYVETLLIDPEKQVSLLDPGVVADGDFADETRYVRGDIDHVGAHAPVTRPWLQHVMIPQPETYGDRRGDNDEGRDGSDNVGYKRSHVRLEIPAMPLSSRRKRAALNKAGRQIKP